METLYTIKELSQKYNVPEKTIYSSLKTNDGLKENIIYKGKKTYLNEVGSQILSDILLKEVETESESDEKQDYNPNNSKQMGVEVDIKQIEGYDIVHKIQSIKDSIVDKSTAEEAISILLEQIKEKDNLIKRLVSLIESNQVILEKDREQLLEDTRYYKTLEMLEERAIRFDENIPYLRNKLDSKKNTKKWWKKS